MVDFVLRKSYLCEQEAKRLLPLVENGYVSRRKILDLLTQAEEYRSRVNTLLQQSGENDGTSVVL
jgi:hypothetical protein